MRLIVHLVLYVITVAYIMHYAKKVKADPSRSMVREIELKYEEEEKSEEEKLEEVKLKKRNILVLLVMLIGFGVIVCGTMKYQWYLSQLSCIFIAMGIISGLVGGLSLNGIANQFIEGCRNMIFGAMIVAVARGVMIVLEVGCVSHTIVYAASSVLSHVPVSIAAIGMFFVQSFINLFIPSGSGQAAVTMPIMGPLGDMLHMSKQTTVLAFQLGDGFTNIIHPGSSTTNGNLAVTGTPWTTWFKFVWKLCLIWTIAGAVLIFGAVIIGY